MAGKANRKHGHNRRKPSDIRYKAEMRWEKNAKRRHERHVKAVAKKRRHLAAREDRAKKVA